MVLVPDHVVSLAQDRELGEQAFSQKEEAKKAASKGSYDANTDTDEIAKESPSRKRALTPPWIPELDLHQTWPGFEYKNISKEGFRALRRRTVKIDDSEETPSRTTPMTLRGSKRSMVTADREQASAEKYSSTVPTERRRGPYLLTRHQAASAKVIDNDSPTSEDDSAIGEASISAASSSDDPLVPATATRRFPRKLQRRRLVRNREDENDPESVRRVALSSSSDDPPISATANRRWRKLQQTRLVRNRESKKGLENVPRIALSSSSDDPPIPATATRRFRKKLQLPRLDRDGEGEKGPESVRQVVLSSSSDDPPISAAANRRSRRKLQLTRPIRNRDGDNGLESVSPVALSRRCEQKVDFEASDN